MVIIIPEDPAEPDAREINYQRDNTKAFIDSDPVELTLTHQEMARSAEGGQTLTPVAETSTHIFRLIPQSDVMTSVQTPDGTQLIPTYVLLGEYDADIRQWDLFELNNVKFIVVSPPRPDFRAEEYWYERKADVARR
jgi:hypothetical protein